MQDLNDLYYFVQVVDHGGFAPAGRALGMPKSKLSRRIALLEERLGVRLIQRSTRKFAVTELGQTFYIQPGRCWWKPRRPRRRSAAPTPNPAAWSACPAR